MANDLDKIKATAYQRWMKRMGASRDEYLKVTEILTTDASALVRSDMFGVTHFTSQSAGSDPAAQDLDSVKNTVSSVAYEKLIKLTRKDIRDNPEIFDEVAGKLADSARSTIANLFWTSWAALESTAHPGDQAPYLGGGGGAAFYADTFTAPVAQGNLLTAALSAANLATAKQTMRAYKNPAGLPAGIDISNSNLVLVVPPALEKAAYDIVNGMGEGGGVTESGYSRTMEVAVDTYGSDANDWALVAKSHKPVKMWVRQAPQLHVEEWLGHIYFYAELEAVTFLEPDESGIIFSAVA